MKNILIMLGLLMFCLNGVALSQDISENPKAIFIIPSSNFQDDEFSITKAVLENNGIDVSIASSSLDVAVGMNGLEVKPDSLIEEIELSDYHALIFIGGEGAQEYYQNEEALDLVREAYKNKKYIGAICIAPVILAKAGILRGKFATSSQAGTRQLRRHGAKYRSKDVIVSGKVITAKGPAASKEFANAVVKALQSGK